MQQEREKERWGGERRIWNLSEAWQMKVYRIHLKCVVDHEIHYNLNICLSYAHFFACTFEYHLESSKWHECRLVVMLSKRNAVTWWLTLVWSDLQVCCCYALLHSKTLNIKIQYLHILFGISLLLRWLIINRLDQFPVTNSQKGLDIISNTISIFC